MPFNLKNRSFLKLIDFTQRDLTYILDLARDLKRAKYAGNEVQHLRGNGQRGSASAREKHRTDLRKGIHPDALRL